MPALPPDIRQHGQAALATLEKLPRSDRAKVAKCLNSAVSEIVRMRDGLIEAERAGKRCGDALPRTNAVLSTIFGTEFSIDGLSLKRVDETCGALRKLLASGAR